MTAVPLTPGSTGNGVTRRHRFAHGDDPTTTMVEVGGNAVGGGTFTIMAGPCAVETRTQLLESARACARAGVVALRGGAYKPRTSPYAFQGLGRAGLSLLAEAKAETGLPVVTELTDLRDLENVLDVADVIQIGARNMQNYPLLTELGRTKVPCLLKRGLAATIDEFLLAAEYILSEGNPDVILCERGIRTFERAYRFTLDITAIPVLRELTHLPVIVDPSHAAGRRELVPALAMAAAGVGADGIIVETHPVPAEARCDGPQAIPSDELVAFVEQVRDVARAARSKEVVGAAAAA